MDKQLAKFLNNPVSFRFSRIEAILLDLGFIKTQAKGSHLKFDHLLLQHPLIIPVHHNDCKAKYKYIAAKLIKQLIR